MLAICSHRSIFKSSPWIARMGQRLDGSRSSDVFQLRTMPGSSQIRFPAQKAESTSGEGAQRVRKSVSM